MSCSVLDSSHRCAFAVLFPALRQPLSCNKRANHPVTQVGEWLLLALPSDMQDG